MFVFSSHTRPAHSETSTAALTTPALDRRSLRWFAISAPTATPQDPPPSLAQHGSCRRSSTSSSLPFRTHAGAQNSVVGADQGFRAPSGDQGIGTRFGTRGLSIGPHRGRSTTTEPRTRPSTNPPAAHPPAAFSSCGPWIASRSIPRSWSVGWSSSSPCSGSPCRAAGGPGMSGGCCGRIPSCHRCWLPDCW